jgi:hypothetical protein
MMKPKSCSDLLTAYQSYLNDNMTLIDLGADSCEIVTPFVRPDGDHIRFFVMQLKDALLLTDEGETTDWLFSVGLEFDRNGNRAKRLEHIAHRYRVVFERGVFSLLIEDTNVGSNINRFVTALQSASQLIHLRRPYTARSFRDDVENYLLQENQVYVPNFPVVGKAIEHRVDFYLDSGRNLLLETLAASTVAAATDKLAKSNFKWLDIRETKTSYKTAFLVDDSNDTWESLWTKPKIASLLNSYTDEVMRWSQRTRLLELDY